MIVYEARNLAVSVVLWVYVILFAYAVVIFVITAEIHAKLRK